MTLTHIRIPDAAYDAIVMSLPDNVRPTVGGLSVQHLLLWPDPHQPDIALAIIRGAEATP